MTAGNGALEVRNLAKHFTIGGGLFGPEKKLVRAVNDVSFTVPKGTSLGLVGESGCGKSTVARSLLRLIEPDAGSVVFDGIDVRAAKGAALRQLRRRMQIVFQDPYSSLNPRRTIQQALEEPLRVHRLGTAREIAEKIETAITEVGLPKQALDRYPHEFSGGQRQRIGIARALVLDPELIVADEPVSALDVSVQAQILRVLERLRDKRGLSFLFVSHDLGVVRHFCERVCVMYLGRIVEQGVTAEVFDRPLHPYTKLLRDSSPVPDPTARLTLTKIMGEVPSAANPPPGCTFHPRCVRAAGPCMTDIPALNEHDRGRQAACYHPETWPGLQAVAAAG
ncbi:ABC transporter ATP-binding protein [Microvirga brassicacearum]|uniref:Glutathione import ATP-binding protein GsiA n=1 Tax=Microvirga brassicacearum TaxID=2580413 RepID=A0A5N3PHM6_9HYPH|nr:oligopeptide/dipeptide ABC transporter ATP-binding protein [Microvirga brassicacearum]KAB0269227.1 ATP-binding cassette domain-containing protein [Microvirga brassicacearum]